MYDSVDDLIAIRKNKWNSKHDIEFDKKLRIAFSNELCSNPKIRKEVTLYPEKFIELEFVIVDKNQNIVPFFLNDVQIELCKIINDSKSKFKEGLIPKLAFLVLKGRQQGMTSLLTGYQLASSLLKKNFSGFTLADVADNAEVIFQNKAKYPFSQLPPVLKPTEKFNNKRQFVFDKLNSSWEVDTATENVGRSRTINFFHGSECAFWKSGIAKIQAAIGEAFTKNCMEFYESTANGFNDFEKMWESNEYINCFFEWWRTKEYRLKLPSEEEKASFERKIDVLDDWIFERLRWLRDVIHLDIEQIYWYYKKYCGYIDKDLIKQEYPCTAKEAFLLSGARVFDSEILIHRLANVPKPLKVGYFEYDIDLGKPAGHQISNIRWKNDRNGFIKIYEVPNSPCFTKYCIGGDTAGDGSDYYTGHVLDAKTGKQVAVLKHQFDSDLYTKQMYCLGVYYGNALIGIESNYDSYPIVTLTNYGYTNQYIREEIDSYTQKKKQKYGFQTNSITRPILISRLVEVVRDHSDLINDIDTIEELMTIIKNENGKAEAPSGGHDDQMMGLGIAYQVKEQVSLIEESIIVEREKHFNVEKQDSGISADYGESITII